MDTMVVIGDYILVAGYIGKQTFLHWCQDLCKWSIPPLIYSFFNGTTSFFNQVHIMYLLFLVHNVLFTRQRVFFGIVPSFLAPWIHKLPGHLDSFCTAVCKSFVRK